MRGEECHVEYWSSVRRGVIEKGWSRKMEDTDSATYAIATPVVNRVMYDAEDVVDVPRRL